jgi:hypothetical protein
MAKDLTAEIIGKFVSSAIVDKRTVLRIARLVLVLFMLSLTMKVVAQSANSNQEAVSKANASIILEQAEKNGSSVEATIQTKLPLTAFALETVTLPGEIQAINIASVTSNWQGALYSTASEPITSLADGMRRYEQLYQSSGPADRNAIFVITAFTIRGSAVTVTRAKELVPGSEIVSANDLSQKPESINVASSVAAQKSGTVSAANVQSAAAASSTMFVPSRSELNIQTLANSDRRIDVTFSWNSPQDLSGLSDIKSALEIQVLFRNQASDPSKNNVSFVGGDKPKAFGANFKNFYFDTPALNNAGIAGSPLEHEVTIGSYNARSDFQAGVQYSVWAVMERGQLDANFAKLSFQRGLYQPNIHQDPIGYAFCQLHGGVDPASCVAGQNTTIVTPTNYTNTSFSIIAPTIPSFTSPTAHCPTTVGYPSDINFGSLSEQRARSLVGEILPFLNAFKAIGKPDLGCPTNFTHRDSAWWPRGGITQDFDGSQNGKGKGALLLSPGVNQAYWIHGAIWARYSSTQFGGPKSVVGEPTGNEQTVKSSRGTDGAYQAFQRGYLYFNTPKNQTYYVVNAIAQKYQSVGLHTDQLGFPISDEYAWNGGARNDFEGGYIYWTSAAGAVIVRNSAPPTIRDFSWNSTPIANQPFGGTVTGTGFITGSTRVFFCATSSSSCFEQPAAGITVNNSSTLTVTNVRLSAGAWQLYAQTSAGPSGRSASFTVQAPPSLPTITSFSWNQTPIANKNFSGSVIGTGFVVGNTRVFFCATGSSSCFEQPSAGISVNSSSSLSLTNVRLGSGSWQLYVQTPTGPSSRSGSFTVQAPLSPPTVSGYNWNSTPRANQNFGGTISGTNFVAGNTQVWLCLGGTSSCYQHPSAGITVNSSTSITVSNVNLSSGAWQFYVQTPAGQSARSSLFAVLMGPPTISGYSWSPTPVGNQPFSGSITGSNFVVGATQVFFCISSSNTCYQHPSAGVSVSGASNLTVSNVRLSTGFWQIYLQTANGQSSRSSAFQVR